MTDVIDEIKYFVLPQYYYIINDKNLNIDIIKFENLEILNEKIKIECNFINNEKKNNLTNEQKEKIYNIYKKDFEYFNYEI